MKWWQVLLVAWMVLVTGTVGWLVGQGAATEPQAEARAAACERAEMFRELLEKSQQPLDVSGPVGMEILVMLRESRKIMAPHYDELAYRYAKDCEGR